jgi:hypothetical protein
MEEHEMVGIGCPGGGRYLSVAKDVSISFPDVH